MSEQVARRMNPEKVPEALRPFIPLFEKWGDTRSDTTRYALLDRAESNPAEMQELKDFHVELSRVDKESYEPWLNGPLTESYERAKVYFTFLLMYGELEVEKR